MNYALFQTALGLCGIAWSDRGVALVQLPEASDAETRAQICRRSPDARESTPPPDIAIAISRIVGLLAGQPIDLTDIVLDMDAVPPFHRQVYELARRIPPGQTRTYSELATALGDAGAARAVGQALGDNPFPIVVPCHRVTAAAGRPGGFSAHGGIQTKIQLLVIEGAMPLQGRLFPARGL